MNQLHACESFLLEFKYEKKAVRTIAFLIYFVCVWVVDDCVLPTLPGSAMKPCSSCLRFLVFLASSWFIFSSVHCATSKSTHFSPAPSSVLTHAQYSFQFTISLPPVTRYSLVTWCLVVCVYNRAWIFISTNPEWHFIFFFHCELWTTWCERCKLFWKCLLASRVQLLRFFFFLFIFFVCTLCILWSFWRMSTQRKFLRCSVLNRSSFTINASASSSFFLFFKFHPEAKEKKEFKIMTLV